MFKGISAYLNVGFENKSYWYFVEVKRFIPVQKEEENLKSNCKRNLRYTICILYVGESFFDSSKKMLFCN
jgi:hypothetical protein